MQSFVNIVIQVAIYNIQESLLKTKYMSLSAVKTIMNTPPIDKVC